MSNRLRGLISYLAAAVWWLFDRLYGDDFFQIIRPLLPAWVVGTSGHDILAILIQYGPPVILAVLGTYFFFQASDKRVRQVEVASKDTSRSEAAAEPLPDLNAAAAFKTLMARSVWAKSKVDNSELTQSAMYEAHLDEHERIEQRLTIRLDREIHDLLRLGRIKAWGRPDSGRPLRPIEANEWDQIEIQFDRRSLTSVPANICAVTRGKNHHGGQLKYLQIHFSSEQIYRVFPLLPDERDQRILSIERTPIIGFRDVAQANYGWKIIDNRSLDGPDLLEGLRQAGLDGTIRFWGRPNRNQFQSLNRDEPLSEIPAAHWRDFQFDWQSVIAASENFETATYNRRQSGDPRVGGFLDIHLHQSSAIRWLVEEAPAFRGRHDKSRQHP